MAEIEETKKSVSFGDSTDMNNGETLDLKDESVDKDVEEVTEMLAGLKKKSSKKKSSTATNGDGGEDGGFDLTAKKKKKKKTKDAEDGEEGDEAAGEDTGFDAGLRKKPKKTKKAAPTLAGESSFDAKLAAAGLLQNEEDAAAAPEEPVVEKSPEEEAEELANGTGPWEQESSSLLNYGLLLSRFFTLLHSQHPDLAGDGKSRSYKIPPPQVLREGNKKTIFANLPDICRKMKRTPEHVIQFLFAELGTNGSVDGSGRLVIKGRFQQKQLENVLRRYILEYLTCRTCKSPDTVLNKENRLYFITCNSCGSKRSVTTIKTGFQATVGKRKRMQA